MAAEERRFRRAALPLEAQCHPRGDLTTGWRPIGSLDISAAGMCFQSEDLFEVGTEVEMRLFLPGAKGSLLVGGTIVWEKPGKDGVSEYGMHFFGLTTEQQVQIDELVQFLAKQQAPPPSSA